MVTSSNVILTIVCSSTSVTYVDNNSVTQYSFEKDDIANNVISFEAFSCSPSDCCLAITYSLSSSNTTSTPDSIFTTSPLLDSSSGKYQATVDVSTLDSAGTTFYIHAVNSHT